MGIMNITPWTDIGLRQRTDLYALNNTFAYAGLLEISFYDNPEELAWMKSNDDLIVQTISNGIYTALGIPMPVKSLTLEEALLFLNTEVDIDVEFWRKACNYIKLLDELLIKISTTWKSLK